ncbi:hypothetical protein [Streptomyces sp. Z26]|uniref:hypothetical protein n=1 Tax=Streptomyces sp. Z26 TaxID=2500177 RepID=UPI000EF16DB9|nr:hypothetical protein [Streptomyces sp. Z26]RLL69034.1 hypothetical protein D7M15_21875 [Streptomyces sp. Z26]
MGDERHSAISTFVGTGGDGGGAEDGDAERGDARTSLASAGRPDPPSWHEKGGSGGGLRSDTTLWSGASEGLSGVRSTLRKGATELDENQAGLRAKDIAVTELRTGSAQLAVHRSWNRYLDLIVRECVELTGKLEKAGSDHYRNEQEIKRAFRAEETRPVGNDPSGGHSSRER